ncbi:MAG: hypothetical protein JOZ72_17295 [Alphaproteobacteria bacterium]|nr:hypothetical protein [Alphaproteobacteria bacterium]
MNAHPHAAHAQIPDGLRHAHERLLAHGDLQFDFPSIKPPVTPQWLIDLAGFIRTIWPYARWVVIVLVVLGAFWIVYAIGREIARRWGMWTPKETPAAQTAMPEWRPGPELARNLLRDADALAAQGHYAEAVHLLLLRSIEHIDENRPDLVRPALTSREIGRLEQLPGAARGAFGAMARVVERALFAGRDVGSGEFSQCRAEYERFAFPQLWSAAR